MKWEQYRDRVDVICRSLDGMKIRYDVPGVLAMFCKALHRKTRGWFPEMGGQRESRFWCTEAAVKVAQEAGWDMQAWLPRRQKMVAPVHVERAWKAGGFRVVRDFALLRRVGPWGGGLEQWGPESGDFVMHRNTDPTWFNRLTVYATGGRHFHDEILYRDEHGDLRVLDARVPHMVGVPWGRRMAEYADGECELAVLRPVEFCVA